MPEIHRTYKFSDPYPSFVRGKSIRERSGKAKRNDTCSLVVIQYLGGGAPGAPG